MGKKTNSSKNGVGKTGYPHGEDWKILISCPIQKLIQNG
jgi:hypothetical protein